jgi:hypothetical protein
MEEIAKFIATLMTSRNQAHVFHLQSTSYAAHKALDEYYSGVVGLIDSYAEMAQGRYGIITGYSATNMVLVEDGNVIKYFMGLLKFVDSIRQTLPQDGELNNTVDEISGLISSTLYKLKFLK